MPAFRAKRDRWSVCPKARPGIIRGSVPPDSMLVQSPSPRLRESDTRCTGLDTDRPDTTRRQFRLTRVLLSV
jgi:hypothetical protein